MTLLAVLRLPTQVTIQQYSWRILTNQAQAHIGRIVAR